MQQIIDQLFSKKEVHTLHNVRFPKCSKPVCINAQYAVVTCDLTANRMGQVLSSAVNYSRTAKKVTSSGETKKMKSDYARLWWIVYDDVWAKQIYFWLSHNST